MLKLGENGPPVFPLGALAGRLKLTSPDENFYLQAAVTDGVPGDVDNPRGTHIKLGRGEGTLSIVELGYTPQFESESNKLRKFSTKLQLVFGVTVLGLMRLMVRQHDIIIKVCMPWQSAHCIWSRVS